MAKDIPRPSVKKPSSGAHKPTEDIEVARLDPKEPGRMTLAKAHKCEVIEKPLASLWLENHNDPSMDMCSGAHHAPSYNSRIHDSSWHAGQLRQLYP